MKITISIGQALLVLIEQTRKIQSTDQDAKGFSHHKVQILDELEAIYLLGMDETTADRLNELLAWGEENGWFEDFIISSNPLDINEDPTRRYFETHLAYHTLMISTDFLHMRDITHYLWTIKSFMSPQYLRHHEEIFVQENIDSPHTEFADACNLLLSRRYYQGLSAENRNKLVSLVQSIHFGSMLLLERDNIGLPLPLDLYGEGFFLPENRGRVSSGNTHQVTSCYMGLMKSYMPVPAYDIARSYQPEDKVCLELSPGLRMADKNKCTYSGGQEAWPAYNFSKLVHPFSASISGTILIQVRVISHLLQNNATYFRDTVSLGNFFRSLISVLLYNSGGHALHEFFSVLHLPKVHAAPEFSKIDFTKLTMHYLMYADNRTAFNAALDQAIHYNRVLLNHALMKISLEKHHAKASQHVKSTSEKVVADVPLKPSLKVVQKLSSEVLSTKSIADLEAELQDVSEKCFLAEQILLADPDVKACLAELDAKELNPHKNALVDKICEERNLDLPNRRYKNIENIAYEFKKYNALKIRINEMLQHARVKQSTVNIKQLLENYKKRVVRQFFSVLRDEEQPHVGKIFCTFSAVHCLFGIMNAKVTDVAKLGKLQSVLGDAEAASQLVPDEFKVAFVTQHTTRSPRMCLLLDTRAPIRFFDMEAQPTADPNNLDGIETINQINDWVDKAKLPG